MRAAVVEELGSPPRAGEREAPARGAGEALVEVAAAALNPIEIRVASGSFARRAEPPYVPGLEGAGRVVESDRVAPGRRVRFEGAALPGFGIHGTLAQLAAVEEDSLVELPDAIDDAHAAALGVVGITAALALDRARIDGGERVLVLGATGAVGQATVQLARARGAGQIVAAGRNRDGLARALELGADRAVTLDDFEPLADGLQDAAGGPLHVVVDPLWGPPAMAALTVLAENGRLVNVGQAAGTDVQVPIDQVRNRQGAIHAISSGWTPVAEKAEVYRRLLDDVAAGRLAIAHELIPLDEVASAWERQAESPNRKLVIQISAG
jgi:NADPH:quinone reductase-like Zn-dependent oxidoreductase